MMKAEILATAAVRLGVLSKLIAPAVVSVADAAIQNGDVKALSLISYDFNGEPLGAVLTKGYDPNQPRAPKGSTTGGQWIAAGGGGQLSAEAMSYLEMDIEEAMSAALLKVAPDLDISVEHWGERGTNRVFTLRAVTPVDIVMYRDFLVDMATGEITVEHSGLRISEGNRDKGLGKKLLAASMDAYEDLGVTKINIETEAVGSYAWARYGFHPNDNSADQARLFSQTLNEVAGRLERYHDLMPAPVYEAARKAIDARDLWAVSDLSYKVADKPLGKKLLLNSSWVGELRLNDAKAMARFNAYTGRTRKFDPNQPREPAGTPEGGQWVSQGGGWTARETEAFNELLKRHQFFHGTQDEVLEAILEKGLIPQGSLDGADEALAQINPRLAAFIQLRSIMAGIDESRRGSVYITPDPSTAERFSTWASRANPGSKPIILQIGVPANEMSRIKVDEFGDGGDTMFRMLGHIPPEWISRYHVAEKADAGIFYAVLLVDEAVEKVDLVALKAFLDSRGSAADLWLLKDWGGFDKYDPNQPREPAGSSEGGQWTSASGIIDDHPMSRDNGRWGSSHSASRVISGRAAKLMGIEGYEDDGNTEVTDWSNAFLKAIYESPGSNEPLYHGFANRDNIEWKEGDTLKLPLVATSGSLDDSASYGIWGVSSRNTQPPPTVFEFPKGTRIAGYSRWSKDDAKDFGHQWSEALTAGEFKIKSVRKEKDLHLAWWKPEVTVVRLEPTAWWNPGKSTWERL